MKLLILGNYSSDQHLPDSFGEFDLVWTMNRYYNEYPDLTPDMIMQLHARSVALRGLGEDEFRNMTQKYNDSYAYVCVMNKNEYPEYNKTLAYPLKEVLSKFDRNYFGCTIAYALGYAAIREISQIYLRGFHMVNNAEYHTQVVPAIKMIRELGRRNHIVNAPVMDTWVDFAKITGLNLDAPLPKLEKLYHEAE